jgi:hypothetical protein
VVCVSEVDRRSLNALVWTRREMPKKLGASRAQSPAFADDKPSAVPSTGTMCAAPSGAVVL